MLSKVRENLWVVPDEPTVGYDPPSIFLKVVLNVNLIGTNNGRLLFPCFTCDTDSDRCMSWGDEEVADALRYGEAKCSCRLCSCRLLKTADLHIVGRQLLYPAEN